MTPSGIAEALSLAVAAALMMGGSVTAWAATNTAKRVVGVLIVLAAALVAMAAIGAPTSAFVIAVVLAFGYCALGAAILVRLQEAYGTIEAREIDAADDRDEPPERAG